jgi:hypothetical protein
MSTSILRPHYRELVNSPNLPTHGSYTFRSTRDFIYLNPRIGRPKNELCGWHSRRFLKGAGVEVAPLKSFVSASRPYPQAQKIAVSHFGNDPSNHHFRNDLRNAHTILDLHRVLALKWSYVQHRKSRRRKQFRNGNRHSCLP